jgi:hypothetical protein
LKNSFLRVGQSAKLFKEMIFLKFCVWSVKLGKFTQIQALWWQKNSFCFYQGSLYSGNYEIYIYAGEGLLVKLFSLTDLGCYMWEGNIRLLKCIKNRPFWAVLWINFTVLYYRLSNSKIFSKAGLAEKPKGKSQIFKSLSAGFRYF